jgi:GT2 family glycosyltransferase
MDIDCVAIGINSAATLKPCLESLLNTSYSGGSVHVYYSDCGSTDDSIAIARSLGVKVIERTPEYPTPGGARNAGWQAGTSPLVQFVDSDTVIDPDWLTVATTALVEEVAAVSGCVEEKSPDATVYNWVASQEWNAAPGETKTFGGIVLIRRECLKKTGGYNEELVAGEDPELSQRIRFDGWKLLQLPNRMVYHDLGMTTFSQYWKRGVRTGYSFAAVYDLNPFREPLRKNRALSRIILRGGGGFLFAFGALISQLYFLLIPAVLLFFYPRLFSTKKISHEKSLSMTEAKTYSWHLSLIVVPQFVGAIRYLLGRLMNRPLRNTPNRLATRQTQS